MDDFVLKLKIMDGLYGKFGSYSIIGGQRGGGKLYAIDQLIKLKERELKELKQLRDQLRRK